MGAQNQGSNQYTKYKPEHKQFLKSRNNSVGNYRQGNSYQSGYVTGGSKYYSKDSSYNSSYSNAEPPIYHQPAPLVHYKKQKDYDPILERIYNSIPPIKYQKVEKELTLRQKLQKMAIGNDDMNIQSRKDLYQQFSRKYEPFFSLDSFHKGLITILQLPQFMDIQMTIVKAVEISTLKIQLKNSYLKGQKPDVVTPALFKWLLVYIRSCYELWNQFQKTFDPVKQEYMISIQSFEKAKSYLINEWKLLNINTLTASVPFPDLSHALINERMKHFPNSQSHDDF